jgi:FkbM family methyltransferase
MGIQYEIRRRLWPLGYDIVKYSSQSFVRQKRLFASYGVNLVLDVGANAGQFAQHLRNYVGYRKRIISFEPLSSAFGRLKAKARRDAAWEVFNFALGEADTKGEINIAGNSYSSSLLGMLSSHMQAAPESKYIGQEVIEIRTLDNIFDSFYSKDNRTYLKIDTQGYESRVIAGAEKSLAHIGTIQLEMSLIPLYEGELLFSEMCNLMTQKGYSLVSLEGGLSDQDSGQLLQVDGIFHRF